MAVEVTQAQRRRFLIAEVSRVVPGLYAWLATVLTPALQGGARLPAKGAAVLALLALLGSLLLSRRRPRWARVLGVYGFIGCCFLAWTSLGPLLRSDQLDAVRGALGSVGFLLHALAWGAFPKDAEGAADNLVQGLPLQPRSQPAGLGAAVLAVGVAAGLAPTALAFTVEKASTSLLAHALALGCALLIIGVSTDVALRVGKPHQFLGWRARASRAAWPLAGLGLAVGVGLIWLALR